MNASSITCPQCGLTSYNPHDIVNRYCGNCHAFHDDMAGDPEIEAPLLHFKAEMVHLLTWFKDSPDRGDPACICSLCGEIIDEDEMPLRMFRDSDNTELRLHMDCAKQVIQEFNISQGDQP